MIRKAVPGDIPAVAAIYGRIHDREEAGAGTTGWKRGVYPTEATAREALAADVLFVGRARGTDRRRRAHSTRRRCRNTRWPAGKYAAEAREIMVLHTLVVDPDAAGQGIGTGFVAFYERYARERGCPCLRMDTNEINAPRPRPLQAPRLPAKPASSPATSTVSGRYGWCVWKSGSAR